MAPSLSRSRPLDPLPPMPRRQSCDRCHEQKVRCVTEGRDGALTLGGIAEESASSLAGHVVSSVPCVRCRKAGAVCIYSPQLRSGRPRLRREPAVPPPRKRARRVSRCSSSSSLSASFSQSASPASSSRASTAAASSPGGISLGMNTTHLADHAHEHAVTQGNPIHSSGASTPHCESGNHRGPGFATSPLPTQWQPSPYGSDGNQFMAGMCQLTPVSENTGASIIPCVPLYPNPVPNVGMAPENVMGSYPWAFPSLPDCSLEEVAQINLRIHLAGRALLSSPSRALACLTSPAVNDIFDAACSLINVVDRFVLSRRPTPAPEPHGADKGQTATRYCTEDLFGSPTLPLSPAIDTALDSSICLMLHSCHQAVLGIFEDLSASILVDLAESPLPTPPRTPTDPSFFPPPQYGPQPTAMANLISHILAQLDRAFLPLASESKPRPVREQRSMSTPVVTFRQESPVTQGGSKVGGFYEHPQQQQHHPAGAWQKSGTSPSSSSPSSSSHSLWSEMEQRQMRVGSQVKAVEGLLRQPGSGGL